MKIPFTRTIYFLSKSELLKNISILTSGTILAQLIPIVLQPFLRRQFSPETYGAYSVYLSVLGILIIVVSLKYELAIVLPKKNKVAVNIIGLTLFLNVFINIIILAAILIWTDVFLNYLNLSIKYRYFLYLVPLGTFLYNAYQSFNYWLIREKAFITIATNKLIRRGFEGSGQLGFAIINLSQGLLIGDIFGNIANLLYSYWQSIKKGFSFNDISLTKISYVAKKYSEFPRFNFIPGFLSACSYLLPAILINKFYGSEQTGYFDLAKMLLAIPLALIATSISNVLLQKISEKYRNKETIFTELLPVLFIIFFIAIVEIVIILFTGEFLFSFVFGSEWETSGIISKILVWSFSLNFVVSSLSSLFVSLKKIKLYSLWQFCYFWAIMTLPFFRQHSFEFFLKTYVIIEVIAYCTLMLIMIVIVFSYEKKLNQLTH